MKIKYDAFADTDTRKSNILELFKVQRYIVGGIDGTIQFRENFRRTTRISWH